MPTENRSSNTEMVSVPRVPTPEMLAAAKKSGVIDPRVSEYCYELMLAAAPAEQHQGEPVACAKLSVRELQSGRLVVEVAAFDAGSLKDRGIVPVYTHADPGEVERLREGIRKHWKVVCDQRAELETLRTQLREQDALLDEAYQRDIGTPLKRKIRAQHAALSASAEPSVIACHVDESCGQSAPVERDERAEFEQAYAEEFSKVRGCMFTAHDVASMRDTDGRYGDRAYLNGQWAGWQARAALERKP